MCAFIIQYLASTDKDIIIQIAPPLKVTLA